MRADVAIVGGGPGGLAVASKVKWADVVVYERFRRLGEPPHCTGIVSPSTAERLGVGGELVEAVYHRAVFADRRLRTLCSIEASPLAVKLARPGVEELLAGLAETQGHRVRRGTAVVAVRPGAETATLLLSSGEKVVVERVLIAPGASLGRLPRPPGSRGCEWITGLEARIELGRRVEEDTFYIVLFPALAPRFYVWLAPLDGGRGAVVGLAARRGVRERLLQALRLVEKQYGVARVLGYRGGRILRGPPAAKPLSGETLAWIGDALCASKPFTGGGLYAISVLAQPLASWLEGGDRRVVEEAWAKLRRELLLQRYATKAATLFKTLFYWALRASCTAAAARACKIDYDRHTTLLRCLLGALGLRGTLYGRRG